MANPPATADHAIERRRLERRAPDGVEPVSRVRLRTGRELSVLDVCDGGVLVEGARLLPGTHLDVHVTTKDGRVLVRSRVVRAYVAGVQSDAVRYRGALSFDRLIDTSAVSGYAMPSLGVTDSGSEGTQYPRIISTPSAPSAHRMTA
jgi:hypothetical protein